jgi:hypothetical protein
MIDLTQTKKKTKENITVEHGDVPRSVSGDWGKLSQPAKFLLAFPFVGLVFVIICSTIFGTPDSSHPQPAIVTTVDTINPSQKTETPKQANIREFLSKEILLDDELQRGNLEVMNAANEFDYGVPLPYIIKAELIFEKVLTDSKALVSSSETEKTKSYLIEAVSTALSGVRKIREGLESYPMDKTVVGQGIETYTKSQISLARKNAEISRIKQEFGI